MKQQARGIRRWPAWSGTVQDLRELADTITSQVAPRRAAAETQAMEDVANAHSVVEERLDRLDREWSVEVQTKEAEFDLTRSGPPEEVLTDVEVSGAGLRSVQMTVRGHRPASAPLVALRLSADSGVVLEVHSDSKQFVRGLPAVLGDQISARVPPGARLLAFAPGAGNEVMSVMTSMAVAAAAAAAFLPLVGDRPISPWLLWTGSALALTGAVVLVVLIALGRVSRLELRPPGTRPALAVRLRRWSTGLATLVVVPFVVGIIVNRVS